MEQRQIYHPSTTLSQGVVEMWLNIVPEKSVGTASSKVWDVKPEPEKEFELRVWLARLSFAVAAYLTLT